VRKRGDERGEGESEFRESGIVRRGVKGRM